MKKRGIAILLICLFLPAAIIAAVNIHKNIVRSHHLVSNCGSDEFGEFCGGEAGDQTGHEWDLRPWPDKPWTCVLRYPDDYRRKIVISKTRIILQNTA